MKSGKISHILFITVEAFRCHMNTSSTLEILPAKGISFPRSKSDVAIPGFTQVHPNRLCLPKETQLARGSPSLHLQPRHLRPLHQTSEDELNLRRRDPQNKIFGKRTSIKG